MNLQARLYDPVIGRFLAVDPLAEIQIGITPYHYCGNDPINASDPSGLLLSDRVIEEKEYIERTSHERLMQVISSLNRWDLEAIAMRQKVRNGMMHDLENYRDLADGGANSAYTDLFNSTNYVAAGAGGSYITPQAPNERDRSDATRVSPDYKSTTVVRPDADGYITFSEATQWYTNGNGQELYADLSKIDLSKISSKDFNSIGESKYFNLLSPLYLSNVNDGLVYGNIKLTYLGGNQVFSSFDDYDFDIHNWSIGSLSRNIETIIASTLHGPGNPFRIWFIPNHNGTISN